MTGAIEVSALQAARMPSTSTAMAVIASAADRASWIAFKSFVYSP